VLLVPSSGSGVRCFGGNNYGQLGRGDGLSRSQPPIFDVLSGVQAIAVGSYHSCVILSVNGGVRCWGFNGHGQLGTGDTNHIEAPRTTDVVTGATHIVTGAWHTCVILAANNGVYCWGANALGQLGNGNDIDVLAPPTAPVLTGATAVGTGHSHTCAVKDGGVYCWGSNSNGQLGTGNTVHISTPPVLPVLTGAMSVATGCGTLNTCVVMAGTFGVRCWGSNSRGQLGIGNTTELRTPPSSNIVVV
jgi:trimeric autotransporter adhesin